MKYWYCRSSLKMVNPGTWRVKAFGRTHRQTACLFRLSSISMLCFEFIFSLEMFKASWFLYLPSRQIMKTITTGWKIQIYRTLRALFNTSGNNQYISQQTPFQTLKNSSMSAHFCPLRLSARKGSIEAKNHFTLGRQRWTFELNSFLANFLFQENYNCGTYCITFPAHSLFA